MTKSACVFCQIIEGKIPATKVYEGYSVVGFKDLKPLAEKHYLFIHKNHTKDVNHMMDTHSEDVQDIFKSIQEFSRKENLEERGFRVVTNLGQDAGQTVFHTHFHLLAGEPLGSFGR